MIWYDYYKFTEEQEKEWREWCYKEIRKKYSRDQEISQILMYVDLRYGFVRSYKKEGQLF